MRKLIERFLSDYKNKNKKRFDLNKLEEYIVLYYKSNQAYLGQGGYNELHDQMLQLRESNRIKEIKSAPYNGFNPPLKVRWEIVFEELGHNWEPSKMLRFSDCLNFSYYLNKPSYQTDLEWEYIENIYQFLKSKERREWVSVEERSLELFYDEKFITGRKDANKGEHGILKRLQISYEDLKMKRYGEMFIYWNRGVKTIKNIIILENHSTFFTYKRIMAQYGHIFGFTPDALIYGAGKKIEKSFSFLEEIADLSYVKVLYFGDIDSEGFGIYHRLKQRYPHVDIRLEYEAYSRLIAMCRRNYPLNGQKKNQLYLECFLQEMKPYLPGEDLTKLNYIWEQDFRIPQELMSYDYLAGEIK